MTNDTPFFTGRSIPLTRAQVLSGSDTLDRGSQTVTVIGSTDIENKDNDDIDLSDLDAGDRVLLRGNGH